MSEEAEVTQGLPEGESVVETPAIEEAPEPGTEQAPEELEQPEESPQPKRKPWFQERIDQLTREKYEERRARESIEAELTKLRSGEPADPQAPAEVDRLANERAKEIVRNDQFNSRCNEVYSSGAGEFSDFDDKLGNFRLLGGLPQPVLEAVTQLPDAHKVLYALGGDMDEAARIFSLAPVPMALALAKLSMSPTKTKPVSNAPSPIRPIDGSPKGEGDPEKMDTDSWIKWREEQVKTGS